jgi:hypothetical protein
MHYTEIAMNTVKIVAVAGLFAASAIPGFADSIEALKPGEVIAIMPDGKMARAIITDPKILEALKKDSKPIPWCNMLMAGADGNVYLVNTTPHNPMVICEEMVPQ